MSKVTLMKILKMIFLLSKNNEINALITRILSDKLLVTRLHGKIMCQNDSTKWAYMQWSSQNRGRWCHILNLLTDIVGRICISNVHGVEG